MIEPYEFSEHLEAFDERESFRIIRQAERREEAPMSSKNSAQRWTAVIVGIVGFSAIWIIVGWRTMAAITIVVAAFGLLALIPDGLPRSRKHG